MYTGAMRVRTIGIVGYGAFGTLVHTLIRRFAPHIAVRVHSSHCEPDGTTFFPLADVAQSDALVLAVPIHAFEEALKEALPFAREDTVVVDIATVKVHTVEILRRLRVERYIATHPMWGPESYEKKQGDVNGFRVVVTDCVLPIDDKAQFIAFLRGLGFDVVEMSAEQHDKHLAETLFLTHFIGQIISRGGFNRTDIDTLSFGYLMDAVESVKHDTKLFVDVFKFNPYCKEVLWRFGIAETEIQGKIGA